MQAPTDCCDASFLLETNNLEEREEIVAKERLIKDQKVQLETERRKLVDFAAELAKQVAVVLVSTSLRM